MKICPYEQANVMTTSRIVRGTKIRIFVYFCTLVVILGLLACYNNTLYQLDETRTILGTCHKQQENLSTQLQVISDYKLRLEKALKSEKSDHLKSNDTFAQAVKDEKLKNDKHSMEAKLRFDSLQQRYNLLQTEFEDNKDKIAKTHQEQLDVINELNNKLKETQEKLKELTNSKERLKTDYLNLQIKNEQLRGNLAGQEENSINHENRTNFLQKENMDLRKEIEKLKEKCTYAPRYEDVENSQDKALNADEIQRREEDHVLVMPFAKESPSAKSSTGNPPGKSVSLGSLNGARPLALPTVPPKSSSNPSAPKPGEDVLPVPKKIPDVVVIPEEPQSNDIIDDRYKNQMADMQRKRQDVMDAENVAKEEFEHDGLGLGDPVKQAEKRNFQGQHIDQLAMPAFKEGAPMKHEPHASDFKENVIDQMDVNGGLDEGEDDDQDDYGDQPARHKDPIVRI